MNIFQVLFYQPIYNLIIVLYRLTDENLALAIILVALISRLLLYPFTLKQMKMAETSKEFSEKSAELKKKYANDKEKQQQELLKLQSEYLPSQLSGCLPLIFQFILFINIYSVIRNLISEGAEGFNKVAYSFVPTFDQGYEIHHDFLSIIDLKSSASEIGLGNTDVLPYIFLMILVALGQYGSMKLMTHYRKKDKKVEPKKEKPSKQNKDKTDGTPAPDDFAEIVQQSTEQAMMLMPFMLMLISYSLPSGLALYWTAQSLFVIIQQYFVSRLKSRKQKEQILVS